MKITCKCCNNIKDESEFDYGKEDEICESCVESLLLGAPNSSATSFPMESYWDFEKGDYKKNN